MYIIIPANTECVFISPYEKISSYSASKEWSGRFHNETGYSMCIPSKDVIFRTEKFTHFYYKNSKYLVSSEDIISQ